MGASSCVTTVQYDSDTGSVGSSHVEILPVPEHANRWVVFTLFPLLLVI